MVYTLIFQFPIYLEPTSHLIYQVTIDPWFQIFRELEDEGAVYVYDMTHMTISSKKTFPCHYKKGEQTKQTEVMSSSAAGALGGLLSKAPKFGEPKDETQPRNTRGVILFVNCWGSFFVLQVIFLTKKHG